MEETLYEQLKVCAESGTDSNDELKTHALFSIAISLKRIADKLELSQKQPIVMSAEEYKRFKEFSND